MDKNGMVKRLLVVVLPVVAVIGLTMQGMSAFAETLLPEGQSETTESRQESLDETSEAGESEEQTETVKEQSVSGNDISDEEAENRNGTIAVLADGTEADNILTAEILNKCIVKGTNPSGVTVNLFDYSQGAIPDGSREVAHDYYYNDYWVDNLGWVQGAVITYNLGISQGHLLRFGYRDTEGCTVCSDYGAWNENHTVRWPEIVQDKLYNGYPRLNLLQETGYGRYADEANSATYLTEDKKTESLAYLFAPYSATYKKSYSAVQGLFQQKANGYYYYNSRENFASFNENTNSFILYNSPGVAKKENGNIFYGQFFPFNKATDVFDAYYTDGDEYRLTYSNTAEKDDGYNGEDGYKENNYEPINYGGHGYIKCYAPDLNHYFGLTLEMRFVQPEGGYVDGSTDESDQMIFSFSGDDDVWIFIDDVLVADLGGLHDALGLSINFATGAVNVDGSDPYYLYDSFEAAYGADSIPGCIKFSEENKNTFADNTVHTLKMFYLERGHMASNLSLSFNIQPLPSPPSINEDKDEDIDETEESDSGTDANAAVEISVSDNTLYDSTEIPKTGDDSLIGWWAALCILSLIGIGATVCNLIIWKRKQDKKV